MAMTTISTSVSISSLPALGAEFEGGTFAGITTKPDGTHHAVVLLAGRQTDITWPLAMEWAENKGGELPSRPVASMLLANVKSSLEPDWHWTAEDYASYAWYCYFDHGYIYGLRKSYDGSAVAVRLIPLTA